MATVLLHRGYMLLMLLHVVTVFDCAAKANDVAAVYRLDFCSLDVGVITTSYFYTKGMNHS